MNVQSTIEYIVNSDAHIVVFISFNQKGLRPYTFENVGLLCTRQKCVHFVWASKNTVIKLTFQQKLQTMSEQLNFIQAPTFNGKYVALESDEVMKFTLKIECTSIRILNVKSLPVIIFLEMYRIHITHH